MTARPCAWCHKPAVSFCDRTVRWIVPNVPERMDRCRLPLCRDHAVTGEDGLVFCPTHAPKTATEAMKA